MEIVSRGSIVKGSN
jgi:hypothetical protein